MLSALLMVTLTGCVGYYDGPRAAVYVAPPAVVVEDDYVYYPAYDVYYSSNRHEYASMERGAWISRPAPRGVSVDILMASPSVRMDFHDSPANHHAQVVKQYPKNWAPSHANAGRQDNRKDDKRDDHGGK